MNAVYLAEHSLMRRRCAIKILPAKHLSDQSSVDRFHQEARAVALLDHTNIVRAYDVGKSMDGSTAIHFFAMEFVEGESLNDRVVRDGPLPPGRCGRKLHPPGGRGLAHAQARESCTATSSRQTCWSIATAWSRSSIWGWRNSSTSSRPPIRPPAPRSSERSIFSRPNKHSTARASIGDPIFIVWVARSIFFWPDTPPFPQGDA